MKQKKHLGQHWLVDEGSLESVIAAANLEASDVVLEVGPGPGVLTRRLVEEVESVTAVEFDAELAENLFSADNLTVVNQDILKFDLRSMKAGYKVVANIPYYLTSKLLRILLESPNSPSRITLLIQKEVAERIAAAPGNLSILGVSAQFYADVTLHEVVSAEYFDPPPQVDSQIISLQVRDAPLFDIEPKQFFRVVKAGFANKRKTLINSLSSVLQLPKEQVSAVLADTGLVPTVRAQELSLEQWYELCTKL